MKAFRKKTLINLQNNLRRVAFEGVGLTVLLSLILVMVVSNVIRVVQGGQENYSVYEYEQNALKDLKEKREYLIDELEIVSSEEYGRLLARDVLGLAQGNESLYRTKEDIEFFEVEVELLDISTKDDYFDWWEMILK